MLVAIWVRLHSLKASVSANRWLSCHVRHRTRKQASFQTTFSAFRRSRNAWNRCLPFSNSTDPSPVENGSSSLWSTFLRLGTVCHDGGCCWKCSSFVAKPIGTKGLCVGKNMDIDYIMWRDFIGNHSIAPEEPIQVAIMCNTKMFTYPAVSEVFEVPSLGAVVSTVILFFILAIGDTFMAKEWSELCGVGALVFHG